MGDSQVSPSSSPAAVSKRLTKKRKRSSQTPGQQGQQGLSPDKSHSQHDPGSERNTKPSAAAGWTGDWPPSFKALERTHKALNLVYTFCCTRKHLATTFETIKPAVESHIKRPLTAEEVTLVAALRPDAIKFSYVDELELRPDAPKAVVDEMFKLDTPLEAQIRTPQELDGCRTGREGADKEDVDAGGRKNRDTAGGGAAGKMLLFEFTDGNLKREVQDKKTGKTRSPWRKLRDEDLKLPVYSQKQVADLIDKRNRSFSDAINLFLGSCMREQLEPNMALQCRAEALTPKPLPEQEVPTLRVLSTIPETIPRQRKSIAEIVQQLKESPWYSGQLVPDGHRVFEPREAVCGDLQFRLSQSLVNALYNTKGITQLYAHQAEALNALHEGQNVVVATSTSSGKSLIYQLPALHALESDKNSRAMFVFPTKALAQDQRRSLMEMLAYMPGLEDVAVETFDGDTPMSERRSIRDGARIIFTNPDMLHITILPQEEKWRTFLNNLTYVVVDELHYYNGNLGSHMAFILRRLRRLCAANGNRRVRFISCSATAANPKQHFQTMIGLDDVRLIDSDGSPSGRKEFLCWNTPFANPGDPSSGRGSAKSECARLFCALMLRGVRTIAFCRVRAQCEALVSAIRDELKSLGRPECANLVMSYRGGYTAADRRMIEVNMFEGKLMGIVATTALELGVDIGTLDCVMTWGFPYTIANLRQQSGRAGRRNKDSLSILVGDGFPTDQHFMQNPDELFTRPNAELRVDLENMLVREGHIQCAAFEMPIRPEQDGQYFGRDLAQICHERLLGDDMGFYHCHDRFRPNPSRFLAVRDTEDEHFAIVDMTNGRSAVLEEVEASRAIFTIYDGAIFLHQGHSYLVKEFLPDKLLAKVEMVEVDWFTTQRDFTDIDPMETEAIRQISSSRSLAYYGTIKIRQQVYGFFKVDKSGRVLDAVEVDNPPIVRYSKGMWLDVPKRALEILQARKLNAAAAIHAAEHAVMSLLPTFVISAPGDVRTECKVALKEFARAESQRKRPARMTFYDAKGGATGSGISTKAFDHIDGLLRMALRRIEACQCRQGCVECVTSEACKSSSEVMSKAGSRVVLSSLLNLDIDVEKLPMGPEDRSPADIETVVLALPVPARGHAILHYGDDDGCRTSTSLT
ncbi:hypothetical protein L249_8119 [Ophiocordyceps polyrhachis-furcata BCC 54312]|uniref:DEAD/DEAH box helicase n=1 Tax=Ophiocordyceps polyrhachis-furcata BCC 54312 TaxID=1330021 RepID=A0A367LHS3_9HYPO|nr:hypothetical protein L249_8119 [Ophiocordyceps polyrhachis-furcata BCC 54312]